MLNMSPSSIPSTGAKSDRPKLDVGTYPCQIVGLYDLGVQESKKFDSEEMQQKRELLISVAFSTETYQHEYEGETSEREQMLSLRVTFSGHEKSKLMSIYSVLCNKGDPLTALLGAKCMATVGETKNGKAKITSLNKMMKGLDIPDSISEPVMVDEDQWDILPDSVPAWVQALINDRVQ